MHLIAILLAFLMMHLIHFLSAWSGGPEDSPSTLLVLGFVLLAAYLAGRVARRLKLPRITGYLLVGLLVGPDVFSLITVKMRADLVPIKELAISLIAMTAGGEIKLEWLRGRLRQIFTIAIGGMLFIMAFVFVSVLVFRESFVFLAGQPWPSVLAITLLVAVLTTASSPTVAIAVITDARAQGSFSRTVLGVIVLRDVILIILFTLTMALVHTVVGEQQTSVSGMLADCTREIGGSVLAGFGVGLLLSFYVRYVGAEMPLVVLGACFLIAYIGEHYHLEPLLIALCAGFFVINIAREGGGRLVAGIERCSLPVFCLFFAFAGMNLNLQAFLHLWPVAILLFASRAAGLYAGTWFTSKITGADDAMRQTGWLGLMASAGVLLAVSSIVAKEFPTWGPAVQTVMIAMIVINDNAGPIGFRWALARAGETDKGVG